MNKLIFETMKELQKNDDILKKMQKEFDDVVKKRLKRINKGQCASGDGLK